MAVKEPLGGARTHWLSNWGEMGGLMRRAVSGSALPLRVAK